MGSRASAAYMFVTAPRNLLPIKVKRRMAKAKKSRSSKKANRSRRKAAKSSTRTTSKAAKKSAPKSSASASKAAKKSARKSKTAASKAATGKGKKKSAGKKRSTVPVPAIPPRKPLPFDGGLPRAADLEQAEKTSRRRRATNQARIKQKLGTFKTMLLERRARLLKDVDRRGRDNSIRRPDSGGDEADRAVDAASTDLDLRLTEKESEELALIDEALGKIVDGTYGICEATGEYIEMERLLAIPYTRFSIEHQKRQELVAAGKETEDTEQGLPGDES